MTAECNGPSSCEGATIDGSRSVEVTFDCIQDDACNSAELICGSGRCILDCQTPDSCDGVEVFAGSASSFECIGFCISDDIPATFGNGATIALPYGTCYTTEVLY